MSFSLFQNSEKKNRRKKQQHISVSKLFEKFLSHFLDIKKNYFKRHIQLYV